MSSKNLVLSLFVGIFLFVYMYMGLWTSPFFYLSLAGVLYTCDFMCLHHTFDSQGFRGGDMPSIQNNFIA